jgi:(2R)-3-sulfolactate dehydrogenase (NADP+)
MVDILAAGVTGSSFTFETSSTAQTLGAPPNQGQLLIAIHPAAFGGAAFETRLEVLFSAMLTPEGVRLPGARRIAQRVQARKTGVTISDTLPKCLLAYC